LHQHLPLTPSDQADGDPDWDAIYTDRILPAFAVRSGGQATPRCIFVVGHQGSGKTNCITKLQADLGADVTQRIVPDALVAALPELHVGTERAKALLKAYSTTQCATHCQRLADVAVAHRAHILWERALPGNIPRLALALRQLGYRVEGLTLATPVEESWLGTLHRSLAALAAGDRTVLHVGWPLLAATALRWPAVVDRLEQDLTFDRIAVLDRDGDICFDNTVEGHPDQRQWASPPFAFESLMVERARARTESDLATLLADWKTLRPQVAATDLAVWPPGDLAAFDQHLRALTADPASLFDLSNPGLRAAAAPAWMARLKSDLAAVQSGPEAQDQPSLAQRSARLIKLVAGLASQPIR
jgi:hypothetical protein